MKTRRRRPPRPRVEKSPPRRTSRSWTISARTTMFRRRPRFETLRDPLRSARKTTTTNRGPRRTRERNPTRTPPRPVCAGRAPPWRSAFRRPHRRDRRRRNRSTATTTDRFPTANARSPCSVCTRRPRRRTRLGRAPRSVGSRRRRERSTPPVGSGALLSRRAAPSRLSARSPASPSVCWTSSTPSRTSRRWRKRKPPRMTRS